MNFTHERYHRHEPTVTYLEECSTTDDQEEVTATLDTDIEIKTEVFDEPTISYATKFVAQRIKEEKDDDRDFLSLFLPHMKLMDNEEKENFKANARRITEEVLAMKL